LAKVRIAHAALTPPRAQADVESVLKEKAIHLRQRAPPPFPSSPSLCAHSSEAGLQRLREVLRGTNLAIAVSWVRLLRFMLGLLARPGRTIIVLLFSGLVNRSRRSPISLALLRMRRYKGSPIRAEEKESRGRAPTIDVPALS